jgi:2,3-bisphosphoglycerate-dependent phosphoglycerate mutase
VELILVRHGLPERSELTANPPLSEVGRVQAQRVAKYLETAGVTSIWSSTMNRAIETAEPLATAIGLPIQVHEGICEFDRHGSTYIHDEELKRQDIEAWRNAAANGFGYDIGAFQLEVVTALNEIMNKITGERVAVFCHGGVINVWTSHVLKMKNRLFFEPGYASLSRYNYEANGIIILSSLNEAIHLGGQAD